MSRSPIQLLFTSFLALILTGYVRAQTFKPTDSDLDSLSSYVQMKYGLDQELFNGFQYYNRFGLYKGDPFFPENSFYDGSVSIKGVQYDHVRLKYNSYSQYLILEYTDFKERYNHLRLNNIRIDSFQLGTYFFQKLSLFSKDPSFYQVLSSGPVTCYIHWQKTIHSTSDDLQYSHEYSRAIGTYYISYRGGIQAFTNRNSFISVFPESIQTEIKKYFRHQRLSFREAESTDIQNLLIYIRQLDETLSEH